MYMVMFVLSDPTMLDDVLDAWYRCGVGGVTYMDCSGIHKRRRLREHLPLRYGFEQLSGACEEGHYILFSLVESEEMVRCSLKAAEVVVGDLEGPNTGVFTAWPVNMVKGIHKKKHGE
jgi:hypothetical protein